ncbi:MAG: NUDIX hydrolase [Pseudomonadota bacterium]
MTSQTARPARPLIGVSAAVWREGKVLLALRGKQPSKDLWSLPGGHVELGETLEEAALRELMEETSIRARIEEHTHWLDIIRRDEAGEVETHYVIAVFRAVWLSGEAVAGDDAAAVQWRGPDDLDDLAMTPGTADRIRKMAGSSV